METKQVVARFIRRGQIYPKLSARKDFPWGKDDALRQEHCNACGTKGLGGWVVPNTLWGLDISLACDIHDWDYAFGTAREAADNYFLTNMLRIIEAQNSGWVLNLLRRHRALTYYAVVRDLGRKAHSGTTNQEDPTGV